MSIRCNMMGHTAGTTHHHNQGLDFATCHHCGCDLIRPDGGEWSEVPEGFQVVWREFGRTGDAASVAERMARMAPPPRRREARNARPKPRRDARGRPFSAGFGMVGALANLGKLVGSDVEDDTTGIEASGQYVIRLPHTGTTH
ncbi:MULTISPECIES: hypothetical protein [unclassified Sphingomonas]|uniref:hypothetical protein n=1 Tax=unclassified Sphingomonas TaxID=196159 RepID=UPI0022B33AD5|nr:hypothetical protein [Sphingomonas sp. NIBR02145]WHU03682.1 hypothetical protein O3305_03510 [Sphingomonas sp. NIBR02145]